MKPPEKPGPFDCCGGGCHRCVYDIYAEQVEQYEAWLQAQREKAPDEVEPTEGVDRHAPME